MHKSRILPRVFVVFALLFATSGYVVAKETWIKVKSANFTLIGNAKEKRVREVATKLEQFRHVFRELYPAMSTKSPVPTTVMVFKSKASFKPYKSIRWAAGYFQPGTDINYIALHTGGERQQLYTTIFHEYIHFLMNNNVGKSVMPPWFGEGIAEYYDQFRIEEDKVVTLGLPNDSHLISLQRTKLIPFETFFKIDHYSLQRQGSHSANIFYAQSWALLHYMMKGNNGARRDQLTAFLGMLMNGTDAKTAFAQAFKTDYKSMEKELAKYVRQRRYGITTVTFKKKLIFEDQMRTYPLSEAESLAHLGDLLFNIRKYDDAEKRLTESLMLDPNQSFANATMGMLKMRRDKFSEAKSYLEKAVNTESSNYRIYYQYASVLSREGRSEGRVMDAFSSETAEKIRAALKKSIALNPNYPGSYDLLARVSLMTGDNLDAGIGYLQKALALSPGNQFYRLNLANLYLRKREIEKAIPIIDTVYRTADEDGLRSYAARMLKDLRRIQAEIAAAKRSGYTVIQEDEEPVRLTRRSDGSGYNPPSKEEVERVKREAINRAINRSLRKPAADEKRLVGYLTSVTCPGGKIAYRVKTDSGIIKFSSRDFQNLELAVYNVEVGDFQLGCGLVKKDMRAVITYRPNTRAGSKGEITAIEFIAKEFSLDEK